jgi:hypothetical protein
LKCTKVLLRQLSYVCALTSFQQFDRRSKPEDFILDSHLKESFYTAEERYVHHVQQSLQIHSCTGIRHNDHMKQFLGPKDFGRMVSTGAYRLSMRSPLRYNTEGKCTTCILLCVHLSACLHSLFAVWARNTKEILNVLRTQTL